MSVSEPFIRRPIATSLLGIALMIGGALGYWALPVSALPQVDFPTVQVTTRSDVVSPLAITASFSFCWVTTTGLAVAILSGPMT